ncbi:MAG: DUF4012 domain-containing protein [Pseudomonadales bacterium]|nr:DUF4012 domain-containing protein [Candidatus Woesebacteria bacterium]MCB9800783.1 DUF4012 domain-containing protein [Pseudomonadales bacterium]
MSKKNLTAQDSEFIDPNSPDFPETAEPELDPSTKKVLSSISEKKDTITQEETTSMDTKEMKLSGFDLKNLTRKHKIIAGVAILTLVLLSILGTLSVYAYGVASQMKQQALESTQVGKEAYDLFKTQNLPATQEKVAEINTRLDDITTTYQKLSFMSYIPFANRYYSDGLHGLAAADAGLTAATKALNAVSPYADVLGFSGDQPFQGGTTEDRVKIILETLEKISPELDSIGEDLRIVGSELAQIDPNHYPEKVGDIEVRAMIEQAQELAAGASTSLTEYRPVLQQLPSVAGANGETKKYLVLFQNDNELRPTGGFLTAYAIINITDGKVEAEKSDDIYELDQKFTKTEPIPEELGRYLTTERYWNLRDMNISPDFKESMDKFYESYTGIKGEPDNIDGIIAVDTHFLTSLMKVLGPVEVPGYGTFSAENDPRCDCPEIIYVLSEIITKPTPYLRDDRKGILGPLMRALLSKAYAAPKQLWPELFAEGFASIAGRNVQFYFLDEDHQAAAELAQAAGRMTPPKNGEDFLAIVNANLGGAKSNLFVTYDVEQVVSAPVNGRIEKTVEITYKNPRRADNCSLEAGLLCLNSTLRDWTRLYIPQGAELVEATGFNEEARVYDENGFTVIDGFFILEPLGTAKLSFTYTVPYENEEEYVGKVWKQGGLETFDVLFDVTGGQELVTVDKDITYTTPF